MKSYDSMLDDLPGGYQEYCRRLEIPNIYGSKENFIRSYAYDKVNMNSIVSNLIRAYDNAIVLREEIGSEALAYTSWEHRLFSIKASGTVLAGLTKRKKADDLHKLGMYRYQSYYTKPGPCLRPMRTGFIFPTGSVTMRKAFR